MYVLNVWGTWCIACREEHEALLAIAQQHVVPIIGLDYMDQRDKARQWLTQLGNPYDAVAFDTDGRTAIDWGVYGAPETFLVDGEGRVIFKFISPMTAEVWQREFLPRIAAARGAAHEAREATHLRDPCARGLSLSMLTGLAARAADAVDVYGELRDPALQARYETITHDLRCLVCQNESIADSNVELASDLRRQVREMLIAGKSDDAIFRFHDRSVRRIRALQPAAEPKTLLIWGAPFIMLVVGP